MDSLAPLARIFHFNPVLWKLHDTKWGGLSSQRQLYSRPYLGTFRRYYIYGLFWYVIHDWSQNIPTKLSVIKKIQKVNFHFFFLNSSH